MAKTKETHWKRMFNPEYMGVWCFEDLGVKEITATVKGVRRDVKIIGENGREDHKPVFDFAETGLLPLILNRTNCKKLEQETGTGIPEHWIGTKIVMKVKKDKCFGSLEDTVRIDRIIKPDAAKIACEVCGEYIQPAWSMTIEQLAAYTLNNTGKKLCAKCARSAAGAQKGAETE